MTDIVSQELLEREYWLYIHQAAVTWLWMSANVDLACAGCVNGQSQLMQVYPCEEVLSFCVAVWSLNVTQSVSVSQMCETTDYSSRNLVIAEACNLARGSNVAGLKEEGEKKKLFVFVLFKCSCLPHGCREFTLWLKYVQSLSVSPRRDSASKRHAVLVLFCEQAQHRCPARPLCLQ